LLRFCLLAPTKIKGSIQDIAARKMMTKREIEVLAQACRAAGV